MAPDHDLDSSAHDDRRSRGIVMVPVETPVGTYRVFTKRVGNNPSLKVLLLHGGPGATHEYLAPFDRFFPPAGVEYYYYDQLGSHYSDQPKEPTLWTLDRFVDELEQVRRALRLDRENFVLLGHSWGALLATEYALRYQGHLKGLVLSNMMASVPEYNRYTENVLKPQMDRDAVAEIERFEKDGDVESPLYHALLVEHHYERRVLRMPEAEWPDPVQRAFAHINPDIYVPMQGPSELGLSGTLSDWDRSGDLSTIEVPTLVIGARHDTMDPSYLEGMARSLPNGRYHHCPDGSHLALYDDQDVYFRGLLAFLDDVEGKRG